jgi:hypothetical protein
MEQVIDGCIEDEDGEELDDTEELVVEAPTGCFCVQCVEEIGMVAEVFLLRIVLPVFNGTELQHLDVLTADGSCRYEPAFYCFECWESTEEELTEQQEDIPPLEHPSGIILCDICRSDVLPNELVGLLHFGEIHWSDRAPNCKHSPVFVNMDNDDPKHICIGCLYHLEENRENPLWPGGIEPIAGFTAQTVDDIFERKWRA